MTPEERRFLREQLTQAEDLLAHAEANRSFVSLGLALHRMMQVLQAVLKEHSTTAHTPAVPLPRRSA